jgi:glycosyltransferase involved in cell wall biosynthesis
MMDWPQQCAVVIPCHNEERSIGALVDAVRKILPSVFVVDDGSTDGTAGHARASGAEVLKTGKVCGKGEALRAGWLTARERGFRWTLSMDGDGQHAPGDISAFLNCAEKTGASLVIGNRMEQAFRMPWVRRCVNRWMSRRISAMTGHGVPDSQCGFRLMRLDVPAALGLQATHFEIESEQLAAFLAAGERVEFVPVQVIYRGEQSKIHPWRDTMRWLRWRRLWLRKDFTAAPNHPTSLGVLPKTERPPVR